MKLFARFLLFTPWTVFLFLIQIDLGSCDMYLKILNELAMVDKQFLYFADNRFWKTTAVYVLCDCLDECNLDFQRPGVHRKEHRMLVV